MAEGRDGGMAEWRTDKSAESDVQSKTGWRTQDSRPMTTDRRPPTTGPQLPLLTVRRVRRAADPPCPSSILEPLGEARFTKCRSRRSSIHRPRPAWASGRSIPTSDASSGARYCYARETHKWTVERLGTRVRNCRLIIADCRLHPLHHTNQQSTISNQQSPAEAFEHRISSKPTPPTCCAAPWIP